MSNKGQYVYFMRPVGMLGPIKIGCSMRIDERLEVLSGWSPFKLEVIYSEQGSYKLEIAIHRCFADYHSHREWFHPGPRLLAAVNALMSGKTIAEVVDFNDDRGSIRTTKTGPRVSDERLVGYLSYNAKLRHARIRADKLCGRNMTTPDHIDAIMDRWNGYRRGYFGKRTPSRPTAEEFAALDELIKSPEIHCVPTRRSPTRTISEQDRAPRTGDAA